MLRSSSGAHLLGLAAVIGTASTLNGQSTEQEEFVVIKAGRAITMAGPELRNVDILMVDGKIRLVGKDLSYPKSAKVIDARRELVMPGWIHPRTRSQLSSYSRSGLRADRSVAKEIYLSEIDFEPFLKAGYTAACFFPEGTGVPGAAVIYRTVGPDANRNLGASYFRVTMSSTSRDKKLLRAAVSKARKEIEKVEKARKDWEAKQKKAKEDAAKAEAAKKPKTDDKKETPTPEKKVTPSPEKDKKAETPTPGKDAKKTEEAKKPDQFTPPKIDPTVLPFVEWIRDKKGPPLLYELRKASDYLHLEDVLTKASELPASRMYFSSSSSSDLHHVVDQLGKRKAIVLLEPSIGTLPYTVTQYNLGAELVLAGCKVAMAPRSTTKSAFDQHRMQIAAMVRTGLPREEALKSVTLHAAELIGLDKRIGSLEKGKDADIVFLDGDPLGPDTRVTRIMTLGKIVWEAP